MFIKLLVGELTPLQVTTGRTLMAAVPLLALAAATASVPRMSSGLVLGATVLALLDTVVPYLLISWAQLHINSSTAALTVATMPLFTTLIAAGTRREEGVTGTALGGLIVGFLGMALLAGPQALSFDNGASSGLLAALLGALLYAVAAVYSRTLMHMADPLGLSAVKLVCASILLVPATLALDGVRDFGSLSTQGWIGLVTTGFISTGLGRWVYQWVIVTAGSVRASLVAYIVPLVALVLAWAVLGESIAATTLAGGALILAGVAGVLYGKQLATAWRALGAGARREPPGVPSPEVSAAASAHPPMRSSS
jgi:drug/metabolite transporter (DMT)-like permease